MLLGEGNSWWSVGNVGLENEVDTDREMDFAGFCIRAGEWVTQPRIMMRQEVLGTELCPPPKSYVETLRPHM